MSVSEISSSPVAPPPLPRSRSVAGKIGRFFDHTLGLITILLTLAALSAVPVLHFLSLGYLLESSARIARSGRIRDGLIGLGPAGFVGKILFAGWLIFLPIRLAHSFWTDSLIIDPESDASGFLGGLVVFLIAASLLVIAWAIIRGGRFRDFMWWAPLRFMRWLGEPKSFQGVKHRLKNVFGKSGALLDFFKLGFFGFLGGALWLLIPVLLLFLASQVSNQGLSFIISVIGGICLAFVTIYLPFIQTRFAMTRKFYEFKDWKQTRKLFRRAPMARWIALFVTLLFALPLYILKIELAPREVVWIPNLVFVVFMFPARLLLGWSMARSTKKEQDSHWFFRWTARLGMVPAVVAYVFIVWLTQYLSWHGSYSLFEQHAFLLPAPMLGL